MCDFCVCLGGVPAAAAAAGPPTPSGPECAAAAAPRSSAAGGSAPGPAVSCPSSESPALPSAASVLPGCDCATCWKNGNKNVPENEVDYLEVKASK